MGRGDGAVGGADGRAAVDGRTPQDDGGTRTVADDGGTDTGPGVGGGLGVGGGIDTVAGVDGVPGGWVVAIVDRDTTGTATSRTGTATGRTVRWAVVPAAVGVDMPLGLPVGPAPRACDTAAAAALGRARSSVFPAPPRAVLAARDHAEACVLARDATGRGISLQSFHLLGKIAQWDAVARPPHVVEVHPELALRALAPDVAFATKRTARGAGQRIAALARWVDPAAALADLPAGARMDDVLDALAAAWSADRVARGEHVELGRERDDRGRPSFVAV